MTVLMCMLEEFYSRASATTMIFSSICLNAVLPRPMGMTEEELQRKIEADEISPQDLREQRLPGPFSFLAWLRYM